VDGSAGTGGRAFDAGDDPLRNRVPAGKSADRLTTIMCAAEEHCCPKSDRSFGACKQAMMASSAALDRWATLPELGYDVDRAEAAFSEFEKRASVCDTDILPWVISNAGFRGVARGTVQPGASCLSSDGGTNPDSDAATQAALLASCALPEVNACMIQSSTNWVCAPRSDSGGPCITDMNCLDGLYCQGIYRYSTCAPRVPNGETCTFQSMCESLNCDVANSRCVPGTLESVYCLPYVP
jgi:hypothetical protein